MADAVASPAPTQSIEQRAERGHSSAIKTEANDASTGVTPAADGKLTTKELEEIKAVVETLSEFKDEDGNEIAAPFQRLVNKRLFPDYYVQVKEPRAFSTARGKVLRKQYEGWKEWVYDMALIPHNAQVYNRPSSRIFHDAGILRDQLKVELQKLVDRGLMTADDAALPDLGPLPVAEDSPPPDPNEIEEPEEEEDEEEEESPDPDEDSDDGASVKRKRGRGRPRLSGNVGKGKYTKAAKEKDDEEDDAEAHKKRGRPPKVLTPMESRINTVLKGLRKFKNDQGELKILHFEKLPDKTAMPEYYQEVRNPVAMDLIKKKAKRKKYLSVDAAMKDLELMFENAKSYNLETSQVYKDAVDLQMEARSLAEQEKNKPDSEYMMEDGRIPLPEILHSGELWKIGDWVHIQNPNDLKLPIVAQIYRTWQDQQGQKWINACWYYHPEQTVHHHEKHFFEHEVVKTGQYRDHQVDEIVDRCFVMFFTRYNKGRPRGFPSDKQVYVCEARYNEEKFKFNKIKTWASCVPDEVRDRDYEMDLFDHPRKMKKVPSPIAHYLRDDAKEDDPLPKPNWGAANAPPIMGAVHKRPREANESPPPEPTPSPPPIPPPQAEPLRRPESIARPHTRYDVDTLMSGTPAHASTSAMNNRPHQSPAAYGQQFAAASNRVSGPSPAPALARANSYVSPGLSNTHSHHLPQSPHASFPQPTYPHQSAQLHPQHSNTPAHSYEQHLRGSSVSNSRPAMPTSGSNSYIPPRPIEVYHLTDTANNAIPQDIREQFQRDESGHVLFFTAPPLDISRIPESTAKLGHSVKYLAKKARTEVELEQKRRERDELRAAEAERSRKRKRDEEQIQQESSKKLRLQALDLLSMNMNAGTRAIYEGLYGDLWSTAKEQDEAHLLSIQEAERAKIETIAKHEKEREAARQVKV